MRLNKRFLFLIIATPALVLITALLSLFVYLQAEDLSYQIEAHALTQKYLRVLSVDLLNAETGQRGFLLTGNEGFLQPYYLALKDMKNIEDEFQEIKGLQTLTQVQQQKLEQLVINKLNLMNESISLFKTNQKESSLELIKSERGKIIMDSIRHIIDPAIVSLDKKLAKKQMQLNKYSYMILSLIFLAFIIVLVLCILFYQSVVNEAESRDSLTKSLDEKNKLLKEFTYQSYHQLKTPLRNIGGFLQLLDKKASNKLDDDSKEMIRFSVEACEKMNEQIDEIREMYLK